MANVRLFLAYKPNGCLVHFLLVYVDQRHVWLAIIACTHRKNAPKFASLKEVSESVCKAELTTYRVYQATNFGFPMPCNIGASKEPSTGGCTHRVKSDTRCLTFPVRFSCPRRSVPNKRGKNLWVSRGSKAVGNGRTRQFRPFLNSNLQCRIGRHGTVKDARVF